jgi:hypothetical protein
MNGNIGYFDDELLFGISLLETKATLDNKCRCLDRNHMIVS